MSVGPRLGVAYYPEHWPRARWERDADLMTAAGLEVVRIAEFAWARLEPSQGRFELDWLDDAIGVLAGRGLEVILGTPTAAPPIWLVERHPEILPIHPGGRRHGFGHRRHYCPNQPAFHAAADAIVRALGERYGSDTRIVAWQIDNELGGRCVCERCVACFRDWLRERYGSIANLNESWGTIFWSQTYTDWSQIEAPDVTPASQPDGFRPQAPSPSLALDYRRFMSNSYVAFLQRQVGALRSVARPEQEITHNLMGFKFPEIDYHALAAEVDVVSWDNYPVLDPSARWSSPALAADTMRGLKRAPVWVLEQQVGPIGWEMVRTPHRGQLRLLTYQAIAHGAELVGYFRWRTARFGAEQHWYGILDPHGEPGGRYGVVKELATELRDARDVLAGATVAADAAIVHDYDSRFALQAQPTNPSLGYEETIQRHYEGLARLGFGIDVVSPTADLSQYRLVVAPNLYVVDEGIAERLRLFVEQGGTLVLAPRAGVKDRCNVVPERPLPAWLDELAGVEVVDFASSLTGATARFTGVDGRPDGVFEGWWEQIEPRSAVATAVYEEGDFAETPAIAAHAVGAGRAVYVAGAGNVPTLFALYRSLAAEAGLEPFELPEGVELVPLRRADGVRLSVLLNHADCERSVELPDAEAVTLPRFGVTVLEPVPSTVEAQ
jgi:beta-galactosidase